MFRSFFPVIRRNRAWARRWMNDHHEINCVDIKAWELYQIVGQLLFKIPEDPGEEWRWGSWGGTGTEYELLDDSQCLLPRPGITFSLSVLLCTEQRATVPPSDWSAPLQPASDWLSLSPHSQDPGSDAFQLLSRLSRAGGHHNFTSIWVDNVSPPHYLSPFIIS